MCNKTFCRSPFFRCCLLAVVVSIGFFPPLMASNALAESLHSIYTARNVDHKEIALLKDQEKGAVEHKKNDAAPGESGVTTEVTETTQQLPKESPPEVVKDSTPQPHPAVPPPTEKSEEGLSTAAKVGIGVGIAAVVVGGAALLAGGSGGSDGGSSSGPRYPTAAELVGVWYAQGTSIEYRQTYAGIFNFYEIGNHVYDIYSNDGTHKQGRGSWSVTEGTNTLTIKNDTGSIYRGDFQSENYKTITLRHLLLPWVLVLNRQ